MKLLTTKKEYSAEMFDVIKLFSGGGEYVLSEASPSFCEWLLALPVSFKSNGGTCVENQSANVAHTEENKTEYVNGTCEENKRNYISGSFEGNRIVADVFGIFLEKERSIIEQVLSDGSHCCENTECNTDTEKNCDFVEEILSETNSEKACTASSADLSENLNKSDVVIHIMTEKGNEVRNFVCFGGKFCINAFELPGNADALTYKKLTKRYAKLAVYHLFREVTGKRPPWGSLTGIRPTKVFYESAETTSNPESLIENLFDVTPEKAKLLRLITAMQKGFINKDAHAVDLYVGIPFCVSKCIYCSFTGGVVGRIGKYIPDYVKIARKEVENALEIISDNGLRLDNIYVGGGTPTALTADELGEILAPLKSVKALEFTVEAGRPDTVNKEHLELFKSLNVNRVSVNPQTMNADTLIRINRKHSPEDIVECYKMVSSYGFDVNMDLIAGLPGENREIFVDSLEKCIALDPANITVHTLALKRGSTMKEENIASAPETEVEAMVEYARERLLRGGYMPYYLYRQKYMTGNLENVGYSKPQHQCRYNIDIMEETKSIIACGSNGISKRVFINENRIERFADTKDVKLYIERAENNWKDKKNFFSLR